MVAGPSEIMVIADASANPAFIAFDVLSQAEHGSGKQAVMLSTSAICCRLCVTSCCGKANCSNAANALKKFCKTGFSWSRSKTSSGCGTGQPLCAGTPRLIVQPRELAPKITQPGHFPGFLDAGAVGDFVAGQIMCFLPAAAPAFSGLTVEMFFRRRPGGIRPQCPRTRIAGNNLLCRSEGAMPTATVPQSAS